MVVPKSGDVWKVWKECGIIPQKVVELYWGMGIWYSWNYGGIFRILWIG